MSTPQFFSSAPGRATSGTPCGASTGGFARALGLVALVSALVLPARAGARPPFFARNDPRTADTGLPVSTTPASGYVAPVQPPSAAGAGSDVPASPRRTFVQRVQAVGAPPELARNVENALLAELGRRAGIVPISPAELEQVLEFEENKAILGCDDLERCIAEVGRKVSADQLVATKLGLLGSQLALTIGLIDIKAGRAVRRVAAQSANFAELVQSLPSLLDQLLGVAPPSPTFELRDGVELKLAIVPLAALGVPAGTADAMSQILAAEYSGIRGLTVISQDDVTALLRQVEKEAQLGCTDNLQCVAEIGAALGLSKLVAGSVGKVGTTYVVSLRLIDTRRVEVLSRVVESFDADALELRHAIKHAAHALLGLKHPGAVGGLDITLNVERGNARLGDHTFGFRGHRFALNGVPAGRYPISIAPEGAEYLPLSSDIYVPLRSHNVRSFELQEAPPRWYTRWWVWAIAGGVLTAGAASAVLLSQDAPAGSGSIDIREGPQPGASTP